MRTMQQILDVRSTHVPIPTYLTLGNFDGVHRGHQALLAALQQVAARHFGTAYSAILTFDPHPLAVLRPSAAQPLLTTPAERLAVAARLGLDYGVIQPFNMEIAALSAHGFLTLLKAHLNLAGLVVGPDFALGRNREGTLDRLRELSAELDYTVNVIEPVDWQGHAVRSSLIRDHLQKGEVVAAGELLGRLYHATGTVVEGDRRGRLLGTPTANLQLAAEKLWPADGVYATRAWVLIGGHPRPYWSVTNLGVRPTVDGVRRRFETHILDFPQAGHDGDLYGHQLTVEFVERLRGEQRFNGLPELQAQIQADIRAARILFHSVQLPPDSIFSGGLLPAPGSSTGV
jgi:riboflavin kinase / FMN adenylyltransferase